MFITLMLASYVAAKFNEGRTEQLEAERRFAAPGRECDPPSITADDPDCVLGADAWVALPPAGPAC